MRLTEVVRWCLAGTGATAIEIYFAIQTGLRAEAKDYPYGAPIPVGQCHVDFVFSPANVCTFSWPAVLADVAMVTAILLVASRSSGIAGVIVASVIAIVALELLPGFRPEQFIGRWAVDMVILVATALVMGVVLRLPFFPWAVRRSPRGRGGSSQRTHAPAERRD